MTWLYCLFLIAVIEEMVSLASAIRNYRYAQSKCDRKKPLSPSKVTLIVPCKGVEPRFRDNIASFYRQDYPHYRLWFVVADTSDPAYGQLHRLRDELQGQSTAQEVRIHVAGPTHGCSQKLHNLLFCCRQIADHAEVMAFADSDVHVSSDWLSMLVWPLRRDNVGATTGYRWFIPDKGNWATLALSAINGKVAQMLGNNRFNLTWGGSMAIRMEVFRRLGLDPIWSKALSDDLTLSNEVKRRGLKVVFVPACVVPSHHSVTWAGLWEFGRRQFLITRCYCPGTWWMALLGTLLSVAELWGGLALTGWTMTHSWTVRLGDWSCAAWPFWMAVSGILLASGFVKAVLRQRTVATLLGDLTSAMQDARRADLAAFWLWPILVLALMLSSALGRTIRWRGVHYKILGPTDIQVLSEHNT